MSEQKQLARRRSLVELVAQAGYLAETEGAVPDELMEEFRAEASETLLALGDKVDSYAQLRNWFLKRAAEAEAALDNNKVLEVERLKKRQKRALSDAKRLEEMAIYVIRQGGADAKGKYFQLEGVNYTLKVAKVGPSLGEDIDYSRIPDEFKTANLSLDIPYTTYLGITDKKLRKGKLDIGKQFRLACLNAKISVDGAALLKALKEDCVACKGTGTIYIDPEAVEAGELKSSPCKKCNGTGHRLIEGARLVTGKLRLVVE